MVPNPALRTLTPCASPSWALARGGERRTGSSERPATMTIHTDPGADPSANAQPPAYSALARAVLWGTPAEIVEEIAAGGNINELMPDDEYGCALVSAVPFRPRRFRSPPAAAPAAASLFTVSCAVSPVDNLVALVGAASNTSLAEAISARDGIGLTPAATIVISEGRSDADTTAALQLLAAHGADLTVTDDAGYSVERICAMTEKPATRRFVQAVVAMGLNASQIAVASGNQRALDARPEHTTPLWPAIEAFIVRSISSGWCRGSIAAYVARVLTTSTARAAELDIFVAARAQQSPQV